MDAHGHGRMAYGHPDGMDEPATKKVSIKVIEFLACLDFTIAPLYIILLNCMFVICYSVVYSVLFIPQIKFLTGTV